MKKRSRLALAFALIVTLSLLIGILQVSSLYVQSSQRPEDFAVFYGYSVNAQVLSYLNRFQLVILEPSAFNSSTLSEIKGIKIAYIDLGEFDNASCQCRVNVSSVEIGYDAQWGQPIVNVSSPQWQSYVLCEVKSAMSEGFQGVMFDDLDVAEQYPSVSQGIIEVIKEVRAMYPNAIIGVNRGFILFQNISRFINFVLFEDYGTLVSGPGEVSFVQNLSEIYSETYLLKSHNVTVLALAYANSPGDRFYAFSSELAQREGVPLYITNWNVTALFPQNKLNQDYPLNL